MEKLDGSIGDSIELNDVLLVGGEGDTRIGQPLVDGAKVNAEIVEQGREEDYAPKEALQGYHKKQGHRQYFTSLKITGSALNRWLLRRLE